MSNLPIAGVGLRWMKGEVAEGCKIYPSYMPGCIGNTYMTVA
ncbi:hypothetical protein JCM30566_14350 [Marinitoga arctica]